MSVFINFALFHGKGLVFFCVFFLKPVLESISRNFALVEISLPTPSLLPFRCCASSCSGVEVDFPSSSCQDCKCW